MVEQLFMTEPTDKELGVHWQAGMTDYIWYISVLT